MVNHHEYWHFVSNQINKIQQNRKIISVKITMNHKECKESLIYINVEFLQHNQLCFVFGSVFRRSLFCQAE